MTTTSTTATKAEVTTDTGASDAYTTAHVRAAGIVNAAPPVGSDHAGPILPDRWSLLYGWHSDGGWKLTEARTSGGRVRRDGSASVFGSTRRWSSYNRDPWLGMPEWLRELCEANEPTWTPQPLGGAS